MSDKQTELSIIIKPKDDLTPAIITDNYIHTLLKTFIIVEEATSNKKTGVILHAQLPDGKDILINTTAALFIQMVDCLKGAELRFNEGRPTIPNMPIEDIINQMIQMNSDQIDVRLISDGKNTFGELYELLIDAAVLFDQSGIGRDLVNKINKSIKHNFSE